MLLPEFKEINLDMSFFMCLSFVATATYYYNNVVETIREIFDLCFILWLNVCFAYIDWLVDDWSEWKTFSVLTLQAMKLQREKEKYHLEQIDGGHRR